MTTSGRFQIALGIILSTITLPALSAAQINIVRPSTVSVSAERAELDSLLRIGRTDSAVKLSAADWRAEYSHRLDNPLELLLANADSLHLTDAQVDSIAGLNVLFLRSTNAVWAPVAEYLANLPDHYNAAAAWNHVNTAFVAELNALLVYDPAANAVLTNAQMDRLPLVMSNALSIAGHASDATHIGGGPVE